MKPLRRRILDCFGGKRRRAQFARKSAQGNGGSHASFDACQRRLQAATLVCKIAPATLAAAEHSEKQCTAAQGQVFIDQGRYDQAIREFSCV